VDYYTGDDPTEAQFAIAIEMQGSKEFSAVAATRNKTALGV